VEVVSPDKAPFVDAVSGIYDQYRAEPEMRELIRDIWNVE